MSGIVWEDPGPDRRGKHSGHPGSQWDGILAQLRENSGHWARIATCAQQGHAANLAHKIRKGIIFAARPAGAFEATSRTLTDGEQFAVYARYVGETEAGS